MGITKAMEFTKAITRKPNVNFAAGLTTAEWGNKPDYDLFCRQHQSYVETLRSLGLEVILLDAEPDFPDSHFVEDTAVVMAETAMVTRPGADSRLGEIEKIIPALEKVIELEFIRSPGLLDGGDVLYVDGHFFIGLSQRTNLEGASQLGASAGRQGFTWSAAAVTGALHLKSGVNAVGPNTLLMFEEYGDREEFKDYRKVFVTRGEEPAANSLLVNGTLLTPAGYPETRKRLQTLGRPVIELDMTEAIKMDGGLSCLSLRL